jgi:hypothetical protein
MRGARSRASRRPTLAGLSRFSDFEVFTLSCHDQQIAVALPPSGLLGTHRKLMKLTGVMAGRIPPRQDASFHPATYNPRGKP